MKNKNKTILIILLLVISFLLFSLVQINLSNTKQIEKEESVVSVGFVSLNVFNKSYEIEIKEGDSVYDVMETLQNSGQDFSFKYKEYSGMGVFIEEIKEVRGKAGSYWIYYINGEEASVGVSKYILKGGDVVTWKQE
jgi:uncharacterized membrane protein